MRFFAEDTGHDFAQERELATVGRVVMTTAIAESIEQAQQREQEYQHVGQAFLDALGSRDFETLGGTACTPRARMRSLQWAGYVDYAGRDEILAETSAAGSSRRQSSRS